MDLMYSGLTSNAKTEKHPTGMLMIANVISKFLGFGLKNNKIVRSQCLCCAVLCLLTRREACHDSKVCLFLRTTFCLLMI